MSIIEQMTDLECEQLIICYDKGTGLKTAIAIHDTTLGPALGGVRMWSYTSEEEAVADAIRLARSMTYKAAIAGLNLGGGTAVIIGDPRKAKHEAMMRSLGRFVDSLCGRFIATTDVGTASEDMECLRAETRYVTGLPPYLGGSGDPSTSTAYGVLRAVEACTKHVFGSGWLKSKVVAVQGLGKVGSALARLLRAEGADVVACDIIDEATRGASRQFGATIVAPEEIYDVECDIFCPCALGGVISRDSIARLKAKIVAGSANNQLADPTCGKQLADKGIMYAPDYVANAGGAIQLALELTGHGLDGAKAKVAHIYDAMEAVIARAEAEKISTDQAADRMVEERIQSVRRVKNMKGTAFKPF
ncbi:MAG: Glu/Leu/Phe/Val dehydrogenase [Chloroflexi bacterium]|nr:Glu/Leu/Phe/Val dehydrogenase [Chloroflexota bacterium]